MIASAGWYPDIQNPLLMRYWDGSSWTDHRMPAQQQSMNATPQMGQPMFGPQPTIIVHNTASAAASATVYGYGRRKGLIERLILWGIALCTCGLSLILRSLRPWTPH